MAIVSDDREYQYSGDGGTTSGYKNPFPTYEQVNGDYRKFLGRDASQDEYNKYWANVSGYNGGMISSSPEAQAYATRQTAAPAAQAPAAAAPASGGGGGLRDTIRQGIMTAYGREATDNDYNYWTSKWAELTARGQQIGDPNYAYNRLLGMGAGGSDIATSGPFAGGQGYTLTGDAARAGAPTAAASYSAPAALPAPAVVAPYVPPTPVRDPRMDALYEQLMSRANQSLKVDENDPGIRSQVDASRLQGERQLLRGLQVGAEKLGPYRTGELSNQQRMAAEGLAGNLAQIQAQLVGNEIAARRTEIAQALQGAFGILSQQDIDRLKEADQALQARAQDIGLQQQNWEQAFRQNGAAWEQAFRQNEAARNQSNIVWDQNWKLSGG